MKVRSSTRYAAVIALTGSLFTACGQATTPSYTNQPPKASSSAMSPSAQSETIPTPGDSIDEQTPTDEPTPEESTSQEITGKFGQTVTWNDGIAVTISKPRAYHPSEYAAGGTKNNVVFTVTLKNGTGKRLDPSGFSTKLADSVGEADEIFDTGNLPEAPQTSMRAGKSVTWKIAYGLHQKGMTGLTMEVNPVMDFDHTTAIFEN